MSPWRFIPLLLATVLLAVPARATWSIVVVNTRTGEVSVGVATCLTSTNLRRVVPVIVPGYGAAAVQCMGDSNGTLRPIIWEELQRGTPVDEILSMIEQSDPSFDTRQIAIIDLQGRATAWTGSSCGDWKGELIGQSGDLVYSIQGNVLTGAAVVLAAEQALVSTPGDLATKLMASMEAADAMGGDGRCSCDPFDPPGCGTPPPSFGKSAHCGTMLIARPGDPIEYCNFNSCARGDFYMIVNTKERSASDPNAVDLLRADFDAWRLSLVGRPDAYRSIVYAPAHTVDAAAPEVLSYVLDLRDLNGAPLTQGGATVSLVHTPASAGLASLQGFTDHGDGSYTAEVLSGSQAGLDAFHFRVDDGVQAVSLVPEQRLLHSSGEQPPFNRRTPVAELDTGGVDRAAWIQPDGLVVYWIGNDNNQTVVLRAERADVADPFGPPTVVGDPAVSNLSLADLWVSPDELTVYASGSERGSPIEHIYVSERASTSAGWPHLTRVPELDSGMGDGGPVLSDDGLEIIFHSLRDGTYDLWRSVRLSATGPWQAPERLAELDHSGEEQFPLLIEDGTRLIWTLHGICYPSLNYADRQPDGSWLFLGELPGPIHPHHNTLIANSYDRVSDQMLLTAGDDPASVWIETVEPAYGTLSVSPDQLSVSAGGTAEFLIDLGHEYAQAHYHLMASLSGFTPGFEWRETIVPLVFDDITLESILGANQNGLEEFNGYLNGSGMGDPEWTLAPGTISSPGMIGRSFRFCAVISHPEVFVTNGVLVTMAP